MKKENEMQVTALQRFFEENSNVCIRAQVINGEPWFVAKDVCQALLIKNSREAVSDLDDDEKGVVISDTPGGKQKMNAVCESGLYGLIVRARKPEAKPFKRWIRKEVIPALRKTGIYASQGSLNRNGVEGIYYLGQKFYPYTDMLKELSCMYHQAVRTQLYHGRPYRTVGIRQEARGKTFGTEKQAVQNRIQGGLTYGDEIQL